MNQQTREKFLQNWFSHFSVEPMAMVRQKRFIFVLSHMRSYSSLLCHILGSNPDVSGYLEAQIPGFADEWDLAQLIYALAAYYDEPVQGQFVLNKVLHNRIVLANAVLQHEAVETIFLLRQPEATLKSLMGMLLRQGEEPEKVTPQGALDYYQERLMNLEMVALKRRGRCLFVVAERLMDDTEGVLAFLTAQLGLKRPLHPQYKPFKYTGRPNLGDPSPYIGAGEIVRGRTGYDEIIIPPHMLARAQAAYDRCYQLLMACCRCSPA